MKLVAGTAWANAIAVSVANNITRDARRMRGFMMLYCGGILALDKVRAN